MISILMRAEDKIKNLIRKYALQNAVKYNAPPKAGAIMGKVMKHPELRSRVKQITILVEEVISEINKMSNSAREEELRRLAPELLSELKEKKQPEKGLPPLDIDKPLVMRFAPNPNGPPTIGSARGIVVNSEYVKRYKGKFIIRFDDTDPVTKHPVLEAYEWYLEDCEWLNAKPDEVIIASDRLPLYYEVAEKLIEKNAAYVCFCEQETFKQLKDTKKPCPHREQGVEKNLMFWKKMLSGDYEEHEAVLRIKTDIAHKNPAIRDWVAFRIIKQPHPRTGNKYCVWPTLDFEGGVEDHLCGTTHIIRGKDLMDSEIRQRYLYKHMGWRYPKTLHWGRVKIHELGRFSTSGIKKAIEEGIYSGWDDPRVPTLQALRKRGIRPEAIRRFILCLGLGETDISLSMDNLYAENRRIIDASANRYFFVWQPVVMDIQDAKPKIATPPLHPSRSEVRKIPVGKRVLVCKQDIIGVKEGDRLRLKDLYNIEITCMNPLKARFIGMEMIKNIRIIHWVPPDGVRVKVLSPSGEYTGIGEKGIEKELDKVVQFERFGFVRIDSIGEVIIAYFAHR